MSRTTRDSFANTTNLQSTTLLDEFETTLCPASDDKADTLPCGNNITNRQDAVHDTCDETNVMSHENLNDIITKLKQVANAGTKTSNSNTKTRSGPKVPKKI